MVEIINSGMQQHQGEADVVLGFRKYFQFQTNNNELQFIIIW